MAKKMLIDATHPEETRVVVLDGSKVEDFDFESITKRQLAGNIYLAKVTRVEPSLQAAFVDYGGNRHGFLAFSEIHPDYYQIPMADREALIAEEEAEQARVAEEEDRAGRSRRRAKSSDESSDEDGEDGKSDGGRKRRSRRSRRGRNKQSSDDNGAKADGEENGQEPQTEAEAPATGEAVVGTAVAVAAADAVIDTVSVEDAEGEDTPPAPAEMAEEASEPAEVALAEEVAAPGIAEQAEDGPASAEPGEAPPAVDEAMADAAEGGAPAVEAPVEAAPAETPAAADPLPVTELAEDVPADDPLSDDDDTKRDDGPPRTMAESSGLESDSISGEIGEAAADGPAKPALSEPGAATLDAPAPDAGVARTTDRGEDLPEDGTGSGESTDNAPAEDARTEDVPAEDTHVEDAPAKDDPDTAETPDDGAAEEPSTDETGDTAKDETGGDADQAEDDTARGTDDDDDTEDDDDADVEDTGADDPIEEAAAPRRARMRRRYKIQDVVKVRQIMLVQVVKEERGNKGAALTTYLSLAGRYCVLMPNTARGGGISRKITEAGDRKRLREIVGELEVQKGMGLIVRTAGAERTRPEIKRDYDFLLRQWEQVRELTLKSIAPCLIYEEGSLIKRSIRDLYSKDIDTVTVEGEEGYREAKDYMRMLMPSHAKNVQQYTNQYPLFSRHQVESYLNGLYNPTVQLRSGGYIVIGVTEALVAIDVNSGRSTKEGSIEETALKTNLEAAEEVARQLKLRDLAGLIVIDFIDMDEGRNNRAVEKRMKERLKNDRARIQIGRISAFGLMEMSRQRLRPGMLEATTQPCPHCHGTGMIRSDESLSLSILRELEEEGVRARAAEVVLYAPMTVVNYLINHKRRHIAMIEERYGIAVTVLGDPRMISPEYNIERSKTASRVIEPDPVVVTAESVVDEDDYDDFDVAEAETDADDVAEPRADADTERRDGDADGNRRRRGKRGGRRRRQEDEAESGDAEAASESDGDEDGAETSGEDDRQQKDGRRSRRGRRGGRRRRNRQDEDRQTPADPLGGDPRDEGEDGVAAEQSDDHPAAETPADAVEAVTEADSAVQEDAVPADVNGSAVPPENGQDAQAATAEPDAAVETEAVAEAAEDTPPSGMAEEVAAADTSEAEAPKADDAVSAEDTSAATSDDTSDAAEQAEAPAMPAEAPATAEPAVAEPEPAMAAPAEAPAPEPKPDRPKRRGWWNLRG